MRLILKVSNGPVGCEEVNLKPKGDFAGTVTGEAPDPLVAASCSFAHFSWRSSKLANGPYPDVSVSGDGPRGGAGRPVTALTSPCSRNVNAVEAPEFSS
jgi:hypothetical protein